MAVKFNPAKHWAEVCGHPDAKYAQDGKLFSFSGEFVRDLPPAALKAKAAVNPLTIETPEAVLARASAKLGIKTQGSTVPSALREAAKENAKALAAEDWDTEE